MPSPQTLLHSVVMHLVDDEAIPARLLALGDAAAILMMVDQSLTALFTPAFGSREVLRDRLRTIVEDNPGVHIKIAIVGGDADVRELLPKGGGGVLARRAVQLFHLGREQDEWSLWTSGGARPDSPLGRALEQAGRGELPIPDRAALAQRVDAPPELSTKERARLEEGQAFIKSLQVRPKATWGLLGVLTVIFGCEIWWGGSESILTLVRMGANTEAALGGEPWRLLSSALLHAGIVHIAVNGYVLVMLGGFMEKVLGAARYGVVLGGAALGGGVASALLSPAGVSVGASGAIWGVLGAAAALAWRPGDAIPPVLLGPLRRNAIVNLGLGLAISFVPQVDLWAHLGGGIAGAALVLTGVVTRGVAMRGSGASASEDPHRRRWTIAAGLVAGLMVASLAMAWVHGQPWRLIAAPVTVPVGHGVSVRVPAALAEPVEAESKLGGARWAIGDPSRDPLALEITTIPHAWTPEERALEALQLEREGLPVEPDVTVTRAFGRREGAPWDTFDVEYVDAFEYVRTDWVQVRPGVLLIIESRRWPWPDDTWSDALAEVVASIEVSSP